MCGARFLTLKSIWFCLRFLFPLLFSLISRPGSANKSTGKTDSAFASPCGPWSHRVPCHSSPSSQALDEAGPQSSSSQVTLLPHPSSSTTNTRSEENWGLGLVIHATHAESRVYPFSVVFNESLKIIPSFLHEVLSGKAASY